MNCRECFDYIDAYIDNELDVTATIAVQQHLRDCHQCQQLLEARKSVGALLDNPQLSFEVPDSLLGENSNCSSGASIRSEATDRPQVSHSLALCSVSPGGNDRRHARAGFSESRRDV